ncbi:MAG: 23S rRNA (pseudouridine(1915)-N(3))-methyltransferase RlmH [Pseudomonadota bacterium]
MRLTLLAVGRMKRGPETELSATYVDRLIKAGRGLGISRVETLEISEAMQASTDERKADEAERLLAKIEPSDCLIVLDEHGDDISSRKLSSIMRANLDGGTPNLHVAIGGPDGHGASIIARANHTLRFGRMTWPHQLARVMAAEQLYRASTILNGHPYHRD